MQATGRRNTKLECHHFRKVQSAWWCRLKTIKTVLARLKGMKIDGVGLIRESLTLFPGDKRTCREDRTQGKTGKSFSMLPENRSVNTTCIFHKQEGSVKYYYIIDNIILLENKEESKKGVKWPINWSLLAKTLQTQQVDKLKPWNDQLKHTNDRTGGGVKTRIQTKPHERHESRSSSSHWGIITKKKKKKETTFQFFVVCRN